MTVDGQIGKEIFRGCGSLGETLLPISINAGLAVLEEVILSFIVF